MESDLLENALDAKLIQYRISFLSSFQIYCRSALEDLYAIHTQDLAEADLLVSLRAWCGRQRVQSEWMVQCARDTVKRWRRQPSLVVRRSLKLPSLGGWEPPIFRFECDGYNPQIETRDQADMRIKDAFAGALNKYLSSGTSKRDERPRHGRPRDVRFKWLAMSLEPGATKQQIAGHESIDRSAVTRAINKARLDLGFPLD